MNSKSAGIYSITSKVNGKRYIGSAVRICDRWNNHLSALRNNKHHSQHLQRHYNKYGEQDLSFSILEVVERGELSLQDFKQLLLSKEQSYLDRWNECHFNCLSTAGSPLGYKRKGSKYYSFDKKYQSYNTFYIVRGKHLNFSSHYTEEEAIREVEYLKTLTDDGLLKYKQECMKKLRRPRRGAKNYIFDKARNKYRVIFKINGKHKYFGSYNTEQEAIDKVKQFKQELGNDY